MTGSEWILYYLARVTKTKYGFCPQGGRPDQIHESRISPERRKWQPTPIFLPENPMDREAWGTTIRGGHERVGHD